MSTTSRTTGRPGSRSPSSPRTTRPQRRPVCHHSSDYTAGTRYGSATSRHPPPLTKAGPPPAQPIRGDCRPPPAYVICRSPCRLPLRTVPVCLLEPAMIRAVGRRAEQATRRPKDRVRICVYAYSRILIPLHAARKAIATTCRCLEATAAFLHDHIMSQTEMIDPSRAPLPSYPHKTPDKGKRKIDKRNNKEKNGQSSRPRNRKRQKKLHDWRARPIPPHLVAQAYPVFLGDFLLALMHPTLVLPRKPRPLPWTSPSTAIWPRGRVRVCGD